eukprot:6460091-Amphidinium_carterae.1
MRENGVTPDHVVYRLAMSTCEPAADAEVVLQLLQDMDDHSIALTTETYNAAMRVCSKAGKEEAATRLMDGMRCSKRMSPKCCGRHCMMSVFQKPRIYPHPSLIPKSQIYFPKK